MAVAGNGRDLLARTALAHVPNLLTLLDRNRHSPTYGCFDRGFWHYRIVDFPSGMAQEFVFPLALAWDTNLEGNRWFRHPDLREWAGAGIRYAAASSHRDGAADDYYPFERAAGATAFSLLAGLETCRILDLRDDVVRNFFARRADWLAASREPGDIANHEALIALCLLLAGALLKTGRWEAAAAKRLTHVLGLQDQEGWFREYGGCDPGYQTLTISALAWIGRLRPLPELRSALVRGVDLAAHFMHPDGSYAGEYGSRSTYNYFPHGFELAGRDHPPALALNDRFLAGLAAGRSAENADDHIVGHHAWNYLLAWRDYVGTRPAPAPPAPGRAWFPRAGLLVDRRNGWTLIVATNKGGVLKLFKDDRLVASDTQFSVVQRHRRRLRNAVGHLVDRYETRVTADTISVCGSLGWAKQRRMNTIEFLLLRLFMLTAGRFLAGTVRKVLQRLLIVGKREAPFRFEREICWRDDAWEIRDRLHARSWRGVHAVMLGCDQTSIYVATSRTYQEGQLSGWVDLSDRVAALRAGEPLTLVRRPGG